MNKSLFKDLTGVYNLLDYSRSHSELVFRHRSNGMNTDICFKSVRGVFVQTELKGVEIFLLPDLKSVPEDFNFVTELGYKAYQLKTLQGAKYYINSGVFGVFENDLDILHSPLGDFMWSPGNRLVFWSEDA